MIVFCCFLPASNKARDVMMMMMIIIIIIFTSFIDTTTTAHVCVSVCLHDNWKTNDPKVIKLGTGNDLGISYKYYGF